MMIIHDKRIPSGYIHGLKEHFPFSVFLPFAPGKIRVYESISCHPDIYFFQLDHKTLVHAPGLNTEFLDALKASGTRLIMGEKDPSGAYPGTALYNAARVGNKVFLNKECADKVVLESVEMMDLETVNVTQGYTRCSLLVVSDKAFITSDSKIADAGIKNGMKVLELLPGGVELPGEKYGFIGGAGGLTPEGETAFIGDAGSHPQGPEINKFVHLHSKRYVLAGNLPLYDAGSLLFLSRGEDIVLRL